MIKNIKVQKSLVWFLKAALFLGLCIVFILQLRTVNWLSFKSLSLERPIYLIFCILLLFANWGFELLKWKSILKSVSQEIHFSLLLKSLLSGISTGLITPNRIGNFIGRILYFGGRNRANLILGTLYGNFAQFLVTLLFGGFGLLHSGLYIPEFANFIPYLFLIFLLFSLLFYFSVPFFPIQRVQLFNKKANLLISFQKSSKKLCLPLFLYSVLRFFIFVIQYLLILMAFGVEPTFAILWGITLVYLLSTLTPSIFFSKLIVRETVAIFVLSYFIEQNLIIVCSSLLLWMINLGVPSLVGMFYLFKNKSWANA